MTVATLGVLSVGEAVPGAAAAVASGSAGITAALPDIQSRIDALLAFSPAPVSFAADLTMAQSIVVSIQAAITLGIPEPSIAAQIAAVTALVAELTAQTVAINAQLMVLTDLAAPLAVDGVCSYAFDGEAADLGAQLGGAVTADMTGHVNAVLMVTTVPATWSAMGEIVKVTP